MQQLADQPNLPCMGVKQMGCGIPHRVIMCYKRWVIKIDWMSLNNLFLAFGLAGAVMRTKGSANVSIPSNEALELRGVNYLIGFYYTNAAINFLLTLLIGKCELQVTFTEVESFSESWQNLVGR